MQNQQTFYASYILGGALVTKSVRYVKKWRYYVVLEIQKEIILHKNYEALNPVCIILCVLGPMTILKQQ
jgi:hypothetical protein